MKVNAWTCAPATASDLEMCLEEHKYQDPKDGELCLRRAIQGKLWWSGDSDVQIVLYIWVWKRKTNRTCLVSSVPSVSVYAGNTRMCAWCRYTRGRFESTHGGFFLRAKPRHTPHHTNHTHHTQHTHHTNHAHQHATTHGDTDRDRQRQTDRDRQRQTDRDRQRQTETDRDRERRQGQREKRRRKRRDKTRQEKREDSFSVWWCMAVFC